MLVSGRSLAGIATAVTFPELDVTVDLGECTRAALRTSVVALTHGHADHIGGLAMYLGVRRLYGMADPTIVTPPETVRGVSSFIAALGDLQGRPFDARVVAAPSPGGFIEIGNDLHIGAFAVRHYPEPDNGALSCGYVICRAVRHLRQDFVGLPGPEIAAARERDPSIVSLERIPLVAVSGDTTPEWIVDAPEHVLSARVLFQECTFLGRGRTPEAARKGQHTHVDVLLEYLGRVRSRAIVLYHVSQYYDPAEAARIVAETMPTELRDRVHLFDMGDRL